jgi:uncharacterized membrane protein YeaQ/YmgE (transglycosylase-associated protein family)
MSSLADLQEELVGFFSYSRQDDDDSTGTLSELRDRIQRELRGQLGRSKSCFRLWQDKEAIPPGTLWEEAIKTAVEQSVFFIPIITPTAIVSSQCKFEFDSFLARESALGRKDLVFPILYIRVPALDNADQWRQHPVLKVVGTRQYVDWRALRHLDVNSTEVKREVEWFCDKIVKALNQPWSPAQKRERKKELELLEEPSDDVSLVVERPSDRKPRLNRPEERDDRPTNLGLHGVRDTSTIRASAPRGFGLMGNIIVGIVGAFVGVSLLRQLGFLPFSGLIGSIVNATIGAVVLLVIVGFIRR